MPRRDHDGIFSTRALPHLSSLFRTIMDYYDSTPNLNSRCNPRPIPKRSTFVFDDFLERSENFARSICYAKRLL